MLNNSYLKLQKVKVAEKGATMVEFAIILPLCILLIAGITDIGLTIFRSAELTYFANQVTRLASTSPLLCPDNKLNGSLQSPVYTDILPFVKQGKIKDDFIKFSNQRNVTLKWNIERKPQFGNEARGNVVINAEFKMSMTCIFCNLYKKESLTGIKTSSNVESRGVCSNY